MQQIHNFIRSKGYDFKPILDGNFHEVKTTLGKCWQRGKIIELSGGKTRVVFSFGNWSQEERFVYKEDTSTLSKEELREFQARQRKEEEKARREREELQEEIATRAQKEIQSFNPQRTSRHVYEERKKIGPMDGAFLRPSPSGHDDLIIPMKDTSGKIWGYQKISDTSKTFIDGQRTEALFFQMGTIHPKYPVYLCEGFATGASIWEAISAPSQKKPLKGQPLPPVLVCFNAKNLEKVAEDIRKIYKDIAIVICGDNDTSKKINVGKRAAYRAAFMCRGTVILPQFNQKVVKNNQKLTDFNDISVHFGQKAVLEQFLRHRALTPDECIDTEYNGFHAPRTLGNGHIKMEPQYTDLALCMERDTPYKVQNESEQIYVWNGKKYVDTPESEIRAFAQKNFWINWEPDSTNHLRKEFAGLIKATNLVRHEWFNQSTTGLLNFRNGVLDTKTGTLHPHSADRGFRTMLEYDYDKTADCPVFDKMLSDITQGNDSLSRMLMEYMGYCLSGDKPWAQKALVCVGYGANGKSTFFNILKELIGKENSSAVNISSFNNDQKMYLLDGKLLNVSEESKQTALFKTAEEFKNLVTGGDAIGKKLYSQPYQFENRAKLILSYNTFPRAGDTSHGLLRRLLFANFNAKFDKKLGNLDRSVESKALLELSGIFNKAWGAYTECKKRGEFTEVRESEETLEEFKEDNDPVLRFFNDHCQIVNGSWKRTGDVAKGFGVNEAGRPFVIISELYVEFKEWAKSNGEEFPPNSTHFGRRIAKMLDERTTNFCKTRRHRPKIRGVKQRAIYDVAWHSELDC